MNKLAALAACALLTGCHTVTLTTADGSKASVTSLGQLVKIGSLKYSPTGGLELVNYNLDQLQGLQAAFAAGLAAGKAAGGVP